MGSIPRGATVEVRCSGKGCPRKTWVKRNAPSRLSLTVFRNKRLKVGATLEVRILRDGMIGKVVRLKIGKKRPAQTVLCLAPGAPTRRAAEAELRGGASAAPDAQIIGPA